ncbi:MAG: XdhC family protein [Deltaproteobacteria bacterium]|nr:XdhC family protein [Deltaproteobacteria bacterium]
MMWDWIEAIREARSKAQRSVLMIVVADQGSSPRKKNAKMLVFEDGRFLGSVGGGSLEKKAIEDALGCLADGVSRLISYPLIKDKPDPCCGGSMEIYMEVLNDNPALYLFGAGHVGQAVSQVLAGTPFTVHLIDERPEWIDSEKIPPEIIRHPTPSLEFINKADWNPDKTFVAIMTYDGGLDQEILKAILKRSTRYIGMIGSQNKWAIVRKNLKLTQAELKRIQCPLGQDNGGKSPKEIAVALSNEILSIYHGVREF